jgi:acetolactate synthase II small subunit
MIFSMHIQTRAIPALLEKIIQTTRVRGFLLRALEVKSSNDGLQLRINMTVEGSREPARLINQLHKINGITELTTLHALEEASPPDMAATG